MRYETRDGVPLRGDSYEAVAGALRDASWSPCATLLEFMEQTAAAAALQTGRAVDAHDPEVFIAGLVQAGLLTRID